MPRLNCPRAFLITLALILPSCASSSPDSSGVGDRILLEGARLVLGNGEVIESGSLLIENGRILAVGSLGAVDADGAIRTDVSGRTIIPALIDAHAHLGYEGVSGWGAEHYSRENVIDHLNRYAYYGFGAVFSAGTDPDDLAQALEEAQRDGEIGGARFLFSAGLAPPGQGPNEQFLVHTNAVAAATGRPVVRGASTPAEGTAAVREIAARGIPIIKIWVDDRGGSQTKMSPEVYQAIAEEADRQGIDLFVHQQSAADMPGLVAAGVDGFLHGRLGAEVDDDLARSLADAGIFLVPNLGLGELRREPIGGDPFLAATLGPAVAERLAARPGALPFAPEREAELRAAFRRLLDAGVSIVLGTDAGAVPDHPFGYTGHRELEIFVRLGMTPMQAIVSATSGAADVLGLDDLGALEAGKSADFIVLEENPLTDIRNTRRIVDVYLRGVRVDRPALRDAWISGGSGR